MKIAPRDKREKASDVYSRFAVAKSFEQVFPQIEELRVEVIEDNAVKVGERSVRLYTARDFSGVIDCSNPLCYNGGVVMAELFHDMVRNGQTQHTFSEKCQGYEGSPRGERRYGSCFHHFEIKVSIKYRSSERHEMVNLWQDYLCLMVLETSIS